MFGGQGNDIVATDLGVMGADSIQGNEGDDTIGGFGGIDTLSGGTGHDVFFYAAGDEDGDATGGGPIERIIDMNFNEDRIRLDTIQVTFAANLGAGTGASLAASANNALAAAQALSGGNTAWVAAQFTFGGRTYLAIDQATHGTFSDIEDLLLDITGFTGSIGNSNFI